MIEKYVVVVMDASCGLSALVDTSDDGIIIGGAESECNFIAKKLNRLAALEAVCEEIVEKGEPLALPEYVEREGTVLEDFIVFDIMPKLKAVLEEK